MKVTVQVVIEYEDEEATTLTEEIHCLKRQELSQETLGLTLAEGKEILTHIQEKMLTHQVTDYVAQHGCCNQCQQTHRRNGYQTITYRTLFGDLKLKGYLWP